MDKVFPSKSLWKRGILYGVARVCDCSRPIHGNSHRSRRLGREERKWILTSSLYNYNLLTDILARDFCSHDWRARSGVWRLENYDILVGWCSCYG